MRRFCTKQGWSLHPVALTNMYALLINGLGLPSPFSFLPIHVLFISHLKRDQATFAPWYQILTWDLLFCIGPLTIIQISLVYLQFGLAQCTNDGSGTGT